MSERDNDPVIGRLARRPGFAGVAARQGHRWNIGADAVGGVLLLVALALPWNLYFGMGIPGSSKAVLGLLMVVTLLSVGSLAATYAGPWRLLGARANLVLVGRLRLGLNVAYLLLVLAFVVFDVVQTL